MKTTLLTLLFALLFLGCSTTRPVALPEANAQQLPWGAIDLDVNSASSASIKNSLGSVLTQKADRYSDSNGTVPYNILTLSGGGSRGAFGTGLLLGWNDKGDMPDFDIITGISTGAVMAPFIFVGGEELKNVQDFYTKSHTEDVFTKTWYKIFDGYIMNADPLQELFKEHFNEAFLEKVAAEHKKGRRLYIGSTNIDTGQLIVWDMGAIASSDRSDKYEHFANIIYASTAIPIYLPPQYMEVDVDGDKYYQMHVDGGIYSQVFMVGMLVNWQEVLNFKKSANTDFDVTLYTVANRKYRERDRYAPIEQSPTSIAEGYILTEMDILFDNTLYRLYNSCQKKGIKFRMATIPEKMQNIIISSTEFNPEEMTELFNVGYQFGKSGVKWKEKISLQEYNDNK